MKIYQKGFTLVEMLVVAPIVILAIGAFLTVIISMTGEVLSSRGSNTLSYNIQDALNQIEQDVKQSTTFLGQNNIDLSGEAIQGYNDDATNFTNVGGTSGTSLILNMVATTANPVSTTTDFVYLADAPNACGSDQEKDNVPMTYNVVYFVKDDTLWRRTIMPENYNDGTSVSCQTPWQQPSCSPGYSNGFCKAEDIKLVEGVSSGSFFVNYFTAADNQDPDDTASDPGASLVDRTVALQSAATVRVALSASQSVAGRSIDRSGTLRATRLDANASALANLAAPSIPSAPSISSTTDQNAAVFSWAKVNGATSYNVQYRINSGAWSTVENQTSTNYTVSSSVNNNVVEARVSAVNAAGSSSYGNGSVTIPTWLPLILENGWAYYGNYATPEYTMTSSSVVIIKGTLKNITGSTSNVVVAHLPEPYRPEYEMVFNTKTSSTGDATTSVRPDGELWVSSSDASLSYVNDVTYLPASAPVTWTALSPLNGWSNRNNAYDPPLSYTTDSEGRIHMRGAISTGTSSSGTALGELPTTNDPKLIVSLRSGSGGFNVLNIGPSNSFTSRGISFGSALFANFMYYPNSGSGWINMTLQNSWVTFNSANATPQYFKGSDNIVTLKGLIKSGTTTSGTAMTTLPEGYRPKDTIFLLSACDDSPCAIRLEPDGTIQTSSGVSSAWTSLSGIDFLAEQ